MAAATHTDKEVGDGRTDWAANSQMCIPFATAIPSMSARAFARPSSVVRGR
jgi:hypothetical protein